MIKWILRIIITAVGVYLALAFGLVAFSMMLPEFAHGQELPVPQDTPTITKGYRFSGAWMPDVDSALIGAENFKTLRNLRYTSNSISGVLGYAKINTAPLSHPIIRNGHQLFVNATDRYSNVFVQARNSSGGSAVYLNTSPIPAQGNFTSAAIHTDSSGAGLGRFSEGPGGVVVYSNGVENRIWGGNETRVSAFFTCADGSGTNPKDYTEAVQNTLSSTGNYASIGTQRFWIILSSRALQGVYYTVKTANGAASTTTAKTWNGTAFMAVSGFNDGTLTGGKTLAQSGWMTFTSTVSTAKPYHYQGRYLYAYLFEASAASGCQVSHVVIDAPWQPITDVWDGVDRTNINFQIVRGASVSGHTEATNKQTDAFYPIAATLGNCTASDYFIIMFSERSAGVKLKFIADKVNVNASALSVYSWNGTTWDGVKNLTDGTKNGSATLAQDGLVSWSPVEKYEEFETTLYGETGYAYKFAWNASLLNKKYGDGTEILLDTAFGIPAHNPPPVAKFSGMFQNRLLLINHETSDEPNRIDYSYLDTPAIWNGKQTSDNGKQSLRFGDKKPITAATEILNRVGNTLASMYIVLKNTETYVLEGSSPENYTIRLASKTVGCAAPLTLVTCELGYDIAENIPRHAAIWLSYAGVMSYDGLILKKIDGIDSYFKPSETKAINTAAIENARAWYDSTNREYNLLIPSGAGQTTNNVWLVYDMVHKKWFEKSTGVNTLIQTGFPVQDSDGARYVYGGRDDGYIFRIEHGTSWDGIPISQVVETGDFLFTDNPYDYTCIRNVKIVASRIDESNELSVYHIGDTSDDGVAFNFSSTEDFVWTDTEDFTWNSGSLLTLSLNLLTSSATVVKETTATNLFGTFHRFRFSLSTSDTKLGFRPIGFALQGHIVREDK